ncbi:hypothetical protein H6G20_05580 [Desertifilum sp. FACHB-1129]|uniref:hypothetical protein n=1 Tax=unclassified Desertifilum TaxID=2621682 RepID=UPI001682720E|nr:MULTISPECIES: hypothetical protein [unclassified Desertifilum]MBD2311150.1 hypothetical protein [Desertifilum sp. FACHB-1129]MBD2324017.1 hypothetical protein [Desertifilum sp. FACHB-866]MBD2333952.1 hypothetical protein [Desertifilum sp. FACHB-868]MDA0211264.1 hypothetical protein [Cyanobacteria bacterium FC1]
MQDKSVKFSGNFQGILNTGENSGTQLNQVEGDVISSINDLPSSSQSEEPELKTLLTQLQDAIRADSNLDEKAKVKALKQVEAITKAGQNPASEEMKDKASDAVTMLKGIISGLPAVATIVETCNQLLPLVAKAFGIG